MSHLHSRGRMLVLTSRSLILAAGLLAGITLTGCANSSTSMGEPIPQSSVDQIVKGKTTVADMIQMFGPPDSQVAMGDRTLYTYKHTKIEGSSSFMPYFSTHESVEKSDKLTITFDQSGVVETYHISRGIDQ